MASTKKHRTGIWFKVITALVLIPIFLALLEYTVYVLYEPSRDLFRGFDEDMATLNYDMLREDPELLRSLIPDLEISHPRTEKIMKINSLGYRGPAFEMEKEEGILRVVFLGDATFFGMGLDEDQTIPHLLGGLLREKRPAGSGPVEIINLAVPGYTSFQGAKQAGSLFASMKPDLVIVGFGHTDGEVTNFTDSQAQASISGAQKFMDRMNPYFHWSALYEWIRNKVRSDVYRSNLNSSFLDLDEGREVTARVPLEEFRENLLQIMKASREAGAGIVLFDPNLVNYYARSTLTEVAEQNNAHLVTGRRVFESLHPQGEYVDYEKSGRRHRTIAVQFKNVPLDGEGEPHVLKLIRIPLNQTRFPPMKQKEVLHDDGVNGDLYAGDGVYTALIHDNEDPDFEFTATVKMHLERHLFHLFINNDIFYQMPDRETHGEKQRYYSPVFEFGKPSFHELLMDFDLELPNQAGARILAEALLEPALKSLE